MSEQTMSAALNPANPYSRKPGERLQQRRSTTDPEIKKMDPEIKKILSVAAHDLRNPVSAIIAFTEILRDEGGAQLDAFGQELLSHILSAGCLTIRLLDDLLFVSSSQANNVQLSCLDLAVVLNDCITLNRALSDRKRVQLRLHLEKQHLFLNLDQLKIVRVVNELLSNAIKFSEPDRTIEVALCQQGRFAQISVRDEGCGFGPQQETGLGFAIVNQIVKSHKGVIRVTSKLGVGTSVVVSLPMDLV